MVSVSQWEREAIGERTRDALHHKQAVGQRVGTVPYGWRCAADGRTLALEPSEQAIAALARAQRTRGASLRAIAATLNRRGLRTRRGSAWRFQYVAAVLAAPARAAAAVA
jgi:DNA invertase Pin-like site-specific DNA recombinase